MNRTKTIILIIIAVTFSLLIMQPVGAEAYSETKDGITYYIDDKGDITKSQTQIEDKIQVTYYYPNTKYDNKMEEDIKQVEMYNSEKELLTIYEYNDDNVLTNVTEYKAGTTTENKDTNVQTKYVMDKDGYIESAIGYDEYGYESVTYTFYPNTIYGEDHLSHIDTTVENFYTYDEVLTGTTTTTYLDGGEVESIIAETNVTYYTQNDPALQELPCPGWWENMEKNGCMVVSYSMMYSAFNDDELTPQELYDQGYSCDIFPTFEQMSEENGMVGREVAVESNGTTQDVVFYNKDNIVPNGKETFTLKEAIVDYGMPVQLWTDAEGWNEHIIETGHHSVVAYKYTYIDGEETIYVHDPYLGGEGMTLEDYLSGVGYATSGNFTITSGWVVDKAIPQE